MARRQETDVRVLQLLKTSVGATWALRQMHELVKLAVDVHVAMPPGPLVAAYMAAGVHVHALQTDFPLRRPWTFPGISTEFRKLVASVQPDVIHSHFVGTTLTMRLALGKQHPLPRLFQVPGPLHLEYPFFRLAEIATAGPTDSWIASARWTYDRYRTSGIDESRLFFSYYGVDLNTFATHAKGRLRQELGLNEQTKIVGMVAYMYAPKRYLGQTRGFKGHEDLIDAVELCLKEEPNLICVVIGGAWNNTTRYEQSVREYGRKRLGERIVFLGTRNDVPLLYPDIDVAVHPSHSENVGGALESLILAVPTITTNVGGFPDLVKQDETGLLVPPRNPVALADAIMYMLRNTERAKNMAYAGQLHARRLFDVKANAQEIFDIYQRVT